MKNLKKDTFTLLIVLISMLTAVTIFLPTMAFPNSDSAFSGIEIVFGTEFVNLGSWASGNIEFSILGVLAFLLPLVALILGLSTKNGYMIAILLFVSSAVLLFLMPEYIKTTATVLGTTTDIEIDWVISYGLWIARALTILGAMVATLKVVGPYKK